MPKLRVHCCNSIHAGSRGSGSQVRARYHSRRGSEVAGRASVVLREQVEAAERHAQQYGSIAAIAEVRANVDTAIHVTREKLRLIRQPTTIEQRAMAPA